MPVFPLLDHEPADGVLIQKNAGMRLPRSPVELSDDLATWPVDQIPQLLRKELSARVDSEVPNDLCHHARTPLPEPNVQNNNTDPANLLLGKIGACGSAYASIATADA